jgi:hypothetical protein
MVHSIFLHLPARSESGSCHGSAGLPSRRRDKCNLATVRAIYTSDTEPSRLTSRFRQFVCKQSSVVPFLSFIPDRLTSRMGVRL